MKRFLSCVLAGSLIATVLVGCGPSQPTVFGVPQNQWNSLSKSEKQQVIKGYNQRQRIDAQNAPLNNAINEASGIIQQNNNYKYMQSNFTPPPMPNY